MAKWAWRLDRTPKENVVQLRSGSLVVRIPQRVIQDMVGDLFPAPVISNQLSRWDVETWEDLTTEQQRELLERFGKEWM